MVDIGYKHLVEYDRTANKIVIYRMLDTGETHLYTEILISKFDERRRTLESIGQALGEALILDMKHFRDKIIPMWSED